MDTTILAYLSLEHKQVLASNVILVNMIESDGEERETVGALTPLPRLKLFLCVCIIWISMHVIGQWTLCRIIVRSYTWGKAHHCSLCMLCKSKSFDVGLQKKACGFHRVITCHSLSVCSLCPMSLQITGNVQFTAFASENKMRNAIFFKPFTIND